MEQNEQTALRYLQHRQNEQLDSNHFRKEQEMMIISQYLDFGNEKVIFQNKQSVQTNDSFKESPKIFDKAPVATTTPKNTKKRDFSVHNFQKHLITTLKTHIKVKKSEYSSRSRSNIACELWEYFIKTPKGGKRTIFCLFSGRLKEGRSSLNQTGYEEYNKMIDFFSDYSQKEINEAQLFLCKQIVKQGHRLLQSGLFESRRISRSEDFRNYFKMFVQQLQKGKLALRLTKQTADMGSSANINFINEKKAEVI